MIQIQKYCSNQQQVANSLKLLVDSYTNGKISNTEFEKLVRNIFDINRDKLYIENNTIAVKVSRIVGKKRLDIIKKVLEQEEIKREEICNI